MDLELYKDVCDKRFTKLEDKQNDIHKDVQEIKEKIFNGYEHRMGLLTKLILLILSGVVASIAIPLIRSFL